MHYPQQRHPCKPAAGFVDFVSGVRGWLYIFVPSPALPAQIDDRSTNVVSALRSTYQKHLQPFEAYSRTKLDPGAHVFSKGKRHASERPVSRPNAANNAADDAAEAAEILGSLISMERSASLGQPPPKRIKLDAVDNTVRPSILSLFHRVSCRFMAAIRGGTGDLSLHRLV